MTLAKAVIGPINSQGSLEWHIWPKWQTPALFSSRGLREKLPTRLLDMVGGGGTQNSFREQTGALAGAGQKQCEVATQFGFRSSLRGHFVRR